MKRIFKYQEAISALIHLTLFALIFFLAFLSRFELDIPEGYFKIMLRTLPLVVLIKFGFFYFFAVYKSSWRYPGVYDLVNIIKASTISTMVLGLFLYFFFIYEQTAFPRSIVILDWLLTIMLIGGTRLFTRIMREEFSGMLSRTGPGRRVVIVGAGDAGESLIREIKKYSELNYQAAAFADDNPVKINTSIHGIKVYGPLSNLPEIVQASEAEEILIATPSATGEQMRRIVKFCEETGKPFRTIPSLDRLIDGRVTVSKLREVQIEDLLRREPVKLDTLSIERFLTGKTVLVTGAGGSIGSEICRQVMRFGPRVLVMLDQAESALFEIERELVKYIELPGRLVAKVGDIYDQGCLDLLFGAYHPQVIFHCAAYKHVPMMEFNIREALRNNVLATRMLARTANKFEVQTLVFISTDKAVNPSSVMGASKRLAEKYLQHASQNCKTRFVMVRFGNVLGSQGSAVEVFKKQIAEGGPITVTHPEMRRYFMTIPEAAQLVLQASSIGQGGEVYFLDMGEPILILDLARDLIRLSGLKPEDDIPIVFTGMRPGEKLFEELRLIDENMLRTEHRQIFQVKMNGRLIENLDSVLDQMETGLLDRNDEDALRRWLGTMVVEYKSWGGKESGNE